jgi:hypothetical protein
VEGGGEPLIPTGNHRIWSEDRGAYVRADALAAGERVRTLSGVARLASVTLLPGDARVHNLEVHAAHVFRVGEVGLLVHNTYPETQSSSSLLPGEGQVGTYDDLVAAGSKGDNITPHHIPSANAMSQRGVAKGDGISMNMEHPYPGTGGRHRRTLTYGSQADVGLSPRDALAQGVKDARRIYQEDGLYDANIRGQLQEVIRQNRQSYPEIFAK